MIENEAYVLVEHQSTINSIINNTFQSTQRIKFTAFDVSQKYIIFGVNSGGIYIFNRDPCQFLKLIPSTHGPANLIVISEDEQNLAIATSSGLVIILEECFNSLTFQQQLSSEHEGQTVTAIKWNKNDIFCGDSKGKVSVITLQSFLTKAIFQTPVACLMHLDSQIVQIDTCSQFLLVSTFTRTLLCNTETERYRQIGKKLRDGSFGACFFSVIDEPLVCKNISQNRGIFRSVADNELLSSSEINEALKVYCARPGARLWQADFHAEVIFTLQFKHSLNTKETEIIKLDHQPYDDVKLELKPALEHFSFNKIYKFANKFILSFNEDGIYFFDLNSSSLLAWNSSFNNIKDVKILNSCLYIWHKDLDVSIISLLSVEDLIIRVLLLKQYKFCAELCLKFQEEIESLIETSKKIHLISVLESKLGQCEEFEKLQPLFTRLKQNLKTPPEDRLIQNGIVTVKNVYAEAVNIPESVANFEKSKDPCDILQEQYKISKMYATIETSDFKNLLATNDKNVVFKFLHEFIARNPGCENWCQRVFLKFLNDIVVSLDVEEFDLDLDALAFAFEAFISVNSTPNNVCLRCEFPLPSASKNIVKYYKVGCKLLEKSEDLEKFLKDVPYMYKAILDRISDLDDVKLKLPLLIQFSDENIIKNLPFKLPYDIWDEALKLLITLRASICLNCNEKINANGSLDLKNFGLILIDAINPKNTLKLFKRYSKLLPQGDLDEFFYQYCIFSHASHKSNPTISNVLQDEAINIQFEKSVSTFLHKKYVDKVSYDGSPRDKTPSELSSTCDYCQLPLEIPIIEGICRLKCGHCYHQVCFMYIHTKCNFCNTVF